MSSIESTQHLKAILRDQVDNNNKMSGSYYETAFIIPHLQTSAMPRRPRQPAPTSCPTVGAMASEATLVDKDGITVMSKEKNDASGSLGGKLSCSSLQGNGALVSASPFRDVPHHRAAHRRSRLWKTKLADILRFRRFVTQKESSQASLEESLGQVRRRA
ncbi:hypothetical protein LY78DRAFT_658508 [Colletotrichum sublineola]|nr:hypothetical protein LY78DRAFT_658508 [Colletotrichum sublineola]